MTGWVLCLTQADKVVPYFGGLFMDEPLPQDGVISLPQRCAAVC